MEQSLDAMRNILDQIDVLCVPSIEKSKEFHLNLKDLFDLSIQSFPKVELGPLMELYVTNMDSESIWEQVQSRNRPLNRYIEQNAKKLYQSAPTGKKLDKKPTSKPQKVVEFSSVGACSDEDEDDASGDESDDETMEVDLEDSDDSDDSNDDDSNDDDINDDNNEEDMHSEGEDMDDWLDVMDEAESVRLEKQHGTEESSGNNKEEGDEDEEDDDDDEAFVQRELYNLDSEDGSSEENSEDDEGDAKFSDFFSSSKRVRVQKNKRSSAQRVTEEEEDSEEDSEGEEEDSQDEEEEGDSQDEEENSLPVAETTYSRKKSLLQEQISALEESAMGPKSWEVAGEVKSSQRPENSLLGIPVDVERSSKVTPVINHEYLKTLEDMIIQRIKDSNFDNIVLASAGPKNEMVLATADDVSQEKSKLGLGEIYAEQFLKQSANFDATASQQEKEVNVMLIHFQKVCRQLDALSHFQFAPKPVGSSADSSSMGVQSIALEDVAPISVTSSTAQAPEQSVGKKRGLDAQFVGGEEEVTRSDRQKMRRKQQKKKQTSGTSAASNVISEENDKYQDLKNDSRVIQKNTERNTGKSEYSKSSDFFSRLQEEVSSGINKKKHEHEKTEQSAAQAMRSSRMKL